jgi:hypothetical protein
MPASKEETSFPSVSDSVNIPGERGSSSGSKGGRRSPSDNHRFEYVHGIFLTHYASFLASLFTSFAWLAILWTQKFSTDLLSKIVLSAGALVLNVLAFYFLSGILLYSRLIISRFVPGVVDDEIAKMPDEERKSLAIRLALFSRRLVVARGVLPFGEKEAKVRAPPFFIGGVVILLALTVVELIALWR